MTTSNPAVSRLPYAVLLATGLAGLLCLWTAWCEYPVYSWNEARLAPAFAIRLGLNPYPPVGGGPLSTWIYGPVGILVNLPATYAASAVGALQLACLINFLVVIGPSAFIFSQAKQLGVAGPARSGLALALAVLLIPRPNLVLQVADHAAIAAGLLSCWWLARSRQPSMAALILAAAAFILAASAKQIAIFVLPAQIAYLLLSGQRSTVLRYLRWVALFGMVALTASVAAFGWANLWLNLVAIPGRLPWTEDIQARFAMRAWPLIAQLAVPTAGLLALWFSGRWPRPVSEGGRFFQITALVYLVMIPVGLAGYLKIGGDTNLLHSWDYLLPGVLLAWLEQGWTGRGAEIRLVVVAAAAVALRFSDITFFPTRPFTRHFETAAALTAAYPHAIWFPRNPIITIYADGQVWHSEDGVQTRALAGYGLREPDFRRHLPNPLNAVAYPSTIEQPYSMPLLADLDTTVHVPDWTVHVRRPAAVTPSR